MLHLMLKLLTAMLSLMALSRYFPGIEISNWTTAMVAVLVLGVINALLKPVLGLLTLPVNLLTLGLFSFVLNALLFGLAAYLVPGFEVHGFLNALIGSVSYGILSTFLLWVVETLFGMNQGPNPKD